MTNYSFPKSKSEDSFEGARHINLKSETLSTPAVDNKPRIKTTESATSTLSKFQNALTIRKQSDVQKATSNVLFTGFNENIWLRHLLAGGVAGAVSRTLTAPLDRLKIHRQVYNNPMTLYELLKYLVKSGGVLSLWRGNAINVLKIMPESAVKFTTYEKAKRVLRGVDRRELAFYERFVAGAVAGGLAQTFVYPLEVLKVRLALRTESPEGVRFIVRNMYFKEGIRSFYRGYLPNILGSVPYGGIEFTIYEGLKRHYISHLDLGEEPSFLMLMVCISISSAVGQCCVYPFSLVRTRLQSGLLGNARLLSIFHRIVQDEGPRGLYRGLVPNICKVVPAVSINFVMYEYVSRSLGIYMS